MTNEQKFFLENVKIIMSPQEKQGYITHITDELNKLNIKYEKLYEPFHLRQGDYSFVILGKDYRHEFLVERKFGLAELDKCLTDSDIETKSKETLGLQDIRDNLEWEFVRMNQIGVKERWLFIENTKSYESIREYSSGYEKKNQKAGERIFSTLNSWQCSNRYNFKVLCLPKKEDFVGKLLVKMFYYWRNDMKITYGKNFLTHLKKMVKV